MKEERKSVFGTDKVFMNELNEQNLHENENELDVKIEIRSTT